MFEIKVGGRRVTGPIVTPSVPTLLDRSRSDSAFLIEKKCRSVYWVFWILQTPFSQVIQPNPLYTSLTFGPRTRVLNSFTLRPRVSTSVTPSGNPLVHQRSYEVTSGGWGLTHEPREHHVTWSGVRYVRTTLVGLESRGVGRQQRHRGYSVNRDRTFCPWGAPFPVVVT